MIRNIRCLLFIGLLSIPLMGFGQEDRSEWTRARWMYDRAMTAMGNRDLGLFEARIDTMIMWASEDNDQEQLAYAVQAKGQMHFYRAEYDQALKMTRQNAKIFKELGVRKDQRLLANNVLSQIHKRLGNVDSSFYYLYKAKALLPTIHDSIHYRTHTSTYNDLGVMHYDVGNLDSSAYYFLNQRSFIRPIDTTHLYGTAFNLTKVFKSLKNYREAEKYVEEAIVLTRGARFKSNHARAFCNKADFLLSQGRLSEAEKAAEKCIELHQINGRSRDDIARYSVYASVLLANDRIDEAYKSINSISNIESEQNLEFKSLFYITALEVFLKAGLLEKFESMKDLAEKTIMTLGQKIYLLRLSRLKAEYYRQRGNLDLAYSYLSDYANNREEYLKEESIVTVNRLETQYETEQKEKTIAKQNLAIAISESRTRLLTGGFAVALLLGGLILWFMQRQSRIQSALQLAEIQSLKQENKLIAMQGILNGQEEERRRIAQDLHDNIGSLMTTIKMKIMDIQKSIADVQKINIAGEIDDMLNQASTEIRRISHNMTPVAMELTGLEGAIEDIADQLNSNGINTVLSLKGLNEIVDKNTSVIIYRLIQEIVNNIGKHSNATSASIQSDMIDGNLRLQISDNGKGISKEAWISKSGLGLKSIHSRIKYLDGKIEMNNKSGTTYIIDIPL